LVALCKCHIYLFIHVDRVSVEGLILFHIHTPYCLSVMVV
jgi:hypothetical protein